MTSQQWAWSFDGSAWTSAAESSEPGGVDLLSVTLSAAGAPSTSLGALVLASLFTDAAAAGQGGGWWGDAYDAGQSSDRGPVGSLLWTRVRLALSDELVELIRQDAVAALAWMVSAGLAIPTVRVSRPTSRSVRLEVDLARPAVVDRRYAYLWELS